MGGAQGIFVMSGQRDRGGPAKTLIPTDEQYRVLFTLRRALRQFLSFSEQVALQAGLTQQQQQLLLCVRAHPGRESPRITDLAAHLLIRSHSAVGLVNRTEAMGLLERHGDQTDQRVVHVRLTRAGRDVLDRLTTLELAELGRIAGRLHVTPEFLTALSEEFLSDADAGEALPAG